MGEDRLQLGVVERALQPGGDDDGRLSGDRAGSEGVQRGADENILRLTRDFAAPPEAVWALTQPTLMERWIAASHSFRAENARVDHRPGGRWSVVKRRGEVLEREGGTYHEVVPEARLTYSDHFDGTDFFSVVTVSVTSTEVGTRLELRQTGFPDRASWIEHGRGWPVVLQLMSDALLIAVRADRLLEPRRMTGVEADLEAARAQLEAEGRMGQAPIDAPTIRAVAKT